MSLEDRLAELAEAIDRNTAAIYQAASLQRSPPLTAGQVIDNGAADAEVPAGESTAPPPRPRGRPPKNPPPSPSDLASQGSSATPSTTSPPPAAVSTASTRATAPAAANGSGPSADTETLYNEMKGMATDYCTQHGRTAFMSILAEYGVAVAASLKDTHAAKLPEVVARFRQELQS